LILGLVWAGLTHAQTGQPSFETTSAHKRLRPATFFLDGAKNPTLLAAVREGMDQKISFDGRFSSASVSCGPGCESDWFVDRQTGGVIEVPQSRFEGQMIWNVSARADTDTIVVTYGPMDGIPTKCVARHFRWTGKAFAALDKPLPVKCPG
jgi:hypothetical protein